MEQPQNLEQVLDGLFAGDITRFTPESTKTEVIFKRAGIVQLGKATEFINLLIERADKGRIDAFLTLVAKEQKALMDEGKSVHDINLNNTKLLQGALANGPLLLSLFSSMADAIPRFVSIFTNMTEETYADELVLDEQLVIAAGVLITNYAFFTQSLPLIIKSALKGFAALQKNHGKPKTAQK